MEFKVGGGTKERNIETMRYLGFGLQGAGTIVGDCEGSIFVGTQPPNTAKIATS